MQVLVSCLPWRRSQSGAISKKCYSEISVEYRCLSGSFLPL
jgi:hypothetical protein